VYAFADLFVTVGFSETEPFESSIEDAFGDEAAAAVEAVGDAEDLFGEGTGGLEHGGEAAGEVVAVVLEKVVAIAGESEVEWFEDLVFDLEVRELCVAKQYLFLELVGGSAWLDVPHPAFVALEAEVHVLGIAAWWSRYKISMPVWYTPSPQGLQRQLKQVEKW
jgi:hypothetical protein